VKSRSCVKLVRLLTGLTLSSAVCGSASADTLVMGDRLVFGKLIAIGPEAVTFSPACGPPRSFAKAEVRRVVRNSACKPRPIRPYSAGGEICPDSPIALYEVSLRSPSTKVLVGDVQISNGKLHLKSPDGLVSAHGPAARLVSITRGLFCRASVPPFPGLPNFCREDAQFAINFGPEPLFANRILTRGLSFHLTDDAGLAMPMDDPRGAQVREAFGNAITIWMAALQDLGPELPEAARPAVEAMISRSGSRRYTLLTPPQVVRVGCPDSASFIVRWLSNDARPMTFAGHVKAARAQVEGRTIWINGVTYGCWRASLDQKLSFPAEQPSGPVCYNLTTVLTHEVGHALGLAGHLDRPGVHSIMDSSLWPDATWPSTADALALAAVLAKPIQGAPAGRLDADGLGVELPADDPSQLRSAWRGRIDKLRKPPI
jgi:hypothetical protein